MLIREEGAGDGVIAIGQASHAWLAGQLARAWGNDRFARPEPFEEVCLGAEQHDVGMAEWDLAPRLHRESGRPESFLQMALEDHLGLWSAAPDRLLTQSRYAALLVSLHGTWLYGRRDLATLAPQAAGAIRAYLDHERARQEELVALLGADLLEVRRNQRLVSAWDGLSLALCLGWDPHVAPDVPAIGDATADLRLTAAGAGRSVLDPWPFGAGEVVVRCEGRRLDGRHASEAELRAALARAPLVPLAFTLVPPPGE